MPSIVCYLVSSKPVLGISGLVYTLISFITLAGFLEKDRIKVFVSVLYLLYYSNALNGITPMAGPTISWQSHLTGYLLGVILVLSSKDFTN